MSRTRWLITGLMVALAGSLASNFWLSARVLDGAMAADDMARARTADEETILNLRWMADRYGRFPARNEVEAPMRVRFPEPDHVVKWETDTLLWVDEVGLHYVGDSLGSIVLMNEPRIPGEK